MKNISLNTAVPYFFRRQLHGKVTFDTIRQSVTPESEWDRPENVIEDILRWADDGGRMLDLGNRTDGTTPDAAAKRALK